MVAPGNRSEAGLKALPGALAGTDAPRAVGRVASYQLHILLFVAGSAIGLPPAGLAGHVRQSARWTVTNTGVTSSQPRFSRPALTGVGALVGIVTALVALGVAQLVAALLSSPIGEPVPAVGELSIDHTPPAIKNFAIREFGSSDKTVLVWGIRAVLIIFAIVIGILAVRKLWQGLCALAVFGAIGVYAALIQPSATAADAAPSLVGAAVAAFALRYFSRRAAPLAAARAPGQPSHESAGEPAGAQHSGPAWRPVERARRGDLEPLPDRRRFLLGSAAVAGISLITYAGGSWVGETRDVGAIQSALKLPAPAQPAPPLPPGADLKIPGLSSFITPNSSFYRVDTAIVLPEIPPANWQLRVHGLVRKELVLSFEDLIKRPLIEDYITICCVSNPVGGPYIGNAKWLGASLRALLQEAGIKAGASQLLATSSDGFTSGTPVPVAMDSGRDSMLAVAMNDTALPVEHGFPVRQVIPGLYGYVSACKWIVDIEVTTYEAAQAYWVPRGWDAQAPIKTESRIDVPTGQNPIKAGKRVSIAGEAWAQHKGIEAVEVRVAGGPWQQARLAAVPDLDTWRQWVYEWDVNVAPGTYLIEARATDKTGYTQTALQEPPAPNGASGYPTVSVQVIS
jgi:DMSO/TMAO reductase YedYZ molybdopterin-dependent catalytic subunit